MQLCKKLAVISMTTLLMLPIGLATTPTTAHASYLGDKDVVAKTKLPQKLVGIYRTQFYNSAKDLNAKHGLMESDKVKLTRNGKGSYYESWTGTKKGQFGPHHVKQSFRAVYRTKEKGIYALIPAGKHQKDKRYISMIDTTWTKFPTISFLYFLGKPAGMTTVSKKTNLTF